MNRYARPENFGHPIRNPLLREHYVYRAFDAAGRLLYVGCTARPEQRFVAHRGSEWHGLAARWTFAGPYNYETARQLEYAAIETERSLHNYSSERRALARIHHGLIDRHIAWLIEQGVDWHDALTPALDHATELLPYGNLEPIEFTDLTLPNARRIDAEDAQEKRAAA